MPGVRLGAYEIVSALGAGGMGEVFRARDTKLNRDVALKMLPDAFASDPDRLARFTREAQTLAALNHPNIAHIHGLEESPSPGSGQAAVRALVMELVEGEDLAQRIARGRIPLDEALPIARQIADALEAAHEQGIIHRDLKPANIKVRPDGTVKVLDFGLAKAIEPVGAASNVSQSPTLTTPAMTQAGLILGTAAYMSPEQARGKVVDRRTDLWALGCVIYEMVTGMRPFSGDDVTDTIAAVVRADPDWARLPADTPAALRRLLRRCLEKDRTRRLADAADARLDIDEALKRIAGHGIEERFTDPSARAGVGTWQRVLPWICAAACGLALVLVLWGPWRQTLRPVSPVRLSADLGGEMSLTGSSSGSTTTLSRDGALLAFIAQKLPGGPRQLYVRRLSELQPTALSGTDEAASPFFSPDGQWIGFFAGGKLKKISSAGGPAITLCDASNGRGAAWGEDGTIIFSPRSTASPLLRVSSAGGEPEPLTTLGEGQVTHRWPQILPGGKAVLFTAHTGVSGFNGATLEVQPLPTGTRKVVLPGAFYGRYVPSGHLLYMHDATLFAVTFDLDRLMVTGPPSPVVQGVMPTTFGAAHFAVSDNGTLVYLPGRDAGMDVDVPIEWMDRDAKATPLRGTPANWSNLAFAPDGRRLAVDIFDGQHTEVWTYDWERDSLSPLTSGPGSALKPVWTPDGRRIVFGSSRGVAGTNNLYWQRADGAGEIQRLTNSKNNQGAGSWHPNGKLLAFHELTAQAQDDVFILPMEGDEATGWRPGTPVPFLNSRFAERAPMFSPDGRWLAYQSTESGLDEVYVRPFPGPGGRWKISTGGGTTPTWSRARHELLFATLDHQIMVASYTVNGDTFEPAKPRPWSDGRFVVIQRTGPTRSFDLHPDGERVALAKLSETRAESRPEKLIFIFNFFDELRRIVTAQRQ